MIEYLQRVLVLPDDITVKCYKTEDRNDTARSWVLVSIYDRRMEILKTKHVKCSERVSLYASVELRYS